MIPPDELDSFRRDLQRTLRLYKRAADALALGQEAFMTFAEILDDKREYYEDIVDTIGSRQSWKAQRPIVRNLNDSMYGLSGQLKDLARVVRSYREPTASGGTVSQSADVAALRVMLDGVISSGEALGEKIEGVKRAILRRRGGARGSAQTPHDERPYRGTAGLARINYRRLSARKDRHICPHPSVPGVA